MPKHLLSPEAEAELDQIWLFLAEASGNTEIADRVIDDLTECFWLLARNPHLGQRRDDLRPGLRSFVSGNYVVLYRIEKGRVSILHVAHGKRDIETLLGG